MITWYVTITGIRDDAPIDVKMPLRHLTFPRRIEFGLAEKLRVFVGWEGWWGAEYFTYESKMDRKLQRIYRSHLKRQYKNQPRRTNNRQKVANIFAILAGYRMSSPKHPPKEWYKYQLEGIRFYATKPD